MAVTQFQRCSKFETSTGDAPAISLVKGLPLGIGEVNKPLFIAVFRTITAVGFMIGSLISSLTYLEDKFTVRAAGIPVTSRREAASRLPS
jgi:hypothetical protein